MANLKAKYGRSYKGLRRASLAYARQRAARFDHGEPISRIDMRPMVFVAMFLAVFGILWGASHIKTHAATIDFPQYWDSPPDAYKPPYVTVEIDVAGTAFVEGEAVELTELGSAVLARLPNWPVVLFRPSADSPYDRVAKAINELRRAGVRADEICFDPEQLGDFRKFDRIADEQNHPSAEGHWHLTKSVPDIPSEACSQFNPPIPSLT